MNYEEKYKEALERFKSFKEKYYTKDTNFGDVIFDKTGEMQKDFESIFPQLRESEDERIRKELLEYLTITRQSDFVSRPDRQRWIKYLEKQKEQKPAEWSESDDIMLQSVYETLLDHKCHIRSGVINIIDRAYVAAIDKQIDWLKSLRPSWKPSEEQMEALKDAKMRMSLEGWGLCPLLQSLINELESL
jgi:hypothetical protein